MASRLASAQSAYLRSAAHQPVEWYPWGPEPFERAKAEKKPVLLDIGAVWCHWCHVMDGESYEEPQLAQILNRDWICIKVDRDERPDIDARYQRAVQALSGQGGWPLTAFLTPDGDVFYGGTYFPPEGRNGRAGFPQVLAELARVYREQPDRVRGQATEIRSFIAERSAESQAGAIDPAILAQGADAMAQVFDIRYGGFGTAPKFPHPAACDFLLARWFDTGDRWAREVVERTLTGMANGGMYDHVGGGFHRYSVDARWVVPHFEKMAYDNSELLRAYAHMAGAAESGERQEDGLPPSAALCRRVVSGIVTWVSEVMSDPAGGYCASQDADVGLEDDGDYFTWTTDEARAVLTPGEFAAVAGYYGIDDTGDMHERPGRNVLNVRGGAANEAVIAAARAKLKAARDNRPAPFVDRTLYTGWNAMMASAMLESGEMESHALATLERIFREAADGPGVLHSIGGAVGGILEDQVHVANACVDALAATGDAQWLDRAVALMDHVWANYRADDGGLTDIARSRGGEGFLRQLLKPVQDAPTPSPNGMAGIVLSRLAGHTGDGSWRERCTELLGAFAGGAAQLGVHGATLLRAIDWHLNPVAHVVVVGNPKDPAVLKLRRAARSAYRPRKVITLLESSTHDARLPTHVRAMMDGKTPRAYVCVGTRCAAPADTAEALAETLSTFK